MLHTNNSLGKKIACQIIQYRTFICTENFPLNITAIAGYTSNRYNVFCIYILLIHLIRRLFRRSHAKNYPLVDNVFRNSHNRLRTSYIIAYLLCEIFDHFYSNNNANFHFLKSEINIIFCDLFTQSEDDFFRWIFFSFKYKHNFPTNFS